MWYAGSDNNNVVGGVVLLDADSDSPAAAEQPSDDAIVQLCNLATSDVGMHSHAISCSNPAVPPSTPISAKRHPSIFLSH